MGLIKAGTGALGGVLADQWKEFFYCDSMSNDVLMTKGVKRVGNRSSNTKGSDNIISNGSGIAVADGQCMIIVEQGKVVEVCAEPGEFTFDSSTEPSIFAGSLGSSILETFKTIGKRFTYGGDTGKDQRIYYVNTKEILGNKFGTATPIMFKVVMSKIGMDLDTKVRCSGTYSYRITDPIKFYSRIASNVSSEYLRSEIDSQLKSEMIDALQPAFGELSALELRPSDIPARKNELKKALNTALAYEWTERRGISVESIAISNISIPEDDEEKIQRMQTAATYSNAGMAAGMLAEAQGTAMNTAAGNAGGAMNGFVGMGMAGAMGGMNAANLFTVAQQQQQQMAQQQMAQQQMPQQPAPTAPAAQGWKCSCGATATGKFCTECGSPKPQPAEGWTCSCGAVNQGKFCQNCGSPKPAGAPLYKCDKCGWTPEDPHNPPKFCPECGDIFDDNDKV
ncbi:MAG: SPFH domain-containing protein [Oscillospiraceae bacterium]|nr:SPFH domain-containing protein [Oscillospiraceae bacterium]